VPLGAGTSYVSSRKALRLTDGLVELEAGGDGETVGGDAGGDVLDEKCDAWEACEACDEWLTCPTTPARCRAPRPRASRGCVSRSRTLFPWPGSAADDGACDAVPAEAVPGANAATAAATGTRNFRPAETARARASFTGLNVDQVFHRVNKGHWG
jgi:hypothetical protein